MPDRRDGTVLPVLSVQTCLCCRTEYVVVLGHTIHDCANVFNKALNERRLAA